MIQDFLRLQTAFASPLVSHGETISGEQVKDEPEPSPSHRITGQRAILVRVMSDSQKHTADHKPASDHKQGENTTEVYAIHGAEPEVLAYAMAKYSRSALTMRESLTEISSQKAEQFLNTF